MALIQCPDCGQEISDEATQCIYCGRPKKSEKKPTKVKGTILMSIGGLMMFIFPFLILVDFVLTRILVLSSLTNNYSEISRSSYAFHFAMCLIGSLIMALGILRDKRKDEKQKRILNFTCMAVLFISFLLMGGQYLENVLMDTPERIIAMVEEKEASAIPIEEYYAREDEVLAEAIKKEREELPSLLMSAPAFISLYLLWVLSLDYVVWNKRRKE